MPAKRAANPTAKTKQAMCDNHPEREAAHTTSTGLHSAISLCAVCLRRAPHLVER
jgi:hypothetical protein